MNIDYIAVGSRIRKARLGKGMTQSKLAEMLDVTPEYVSRMENASSRPSLSTLTRVAGFLNVTLSGLLEGTESGGEGYLLYEFSEILEELPPGKRKLLYDFAQLLLKSELQ